MNYEKLMNDIAYMTAGGRVNSWEIIKGIKSFESFPYRDLTNDEILALYEMCADLWFIADMSDSYKVTCSEHNQISPVYGAVKAEAKARGLK